MAPTRDENLVLEPGGCREVQRGQTVPEGRILHRDDREIAVMSNVANLGNVPNRVAVTAAINQTKENIP